MAFIKNLFNRIVLTLIAAVVLLGVSYLLSVGLKEVFNIVLSVKGIFAILAAIYLIKEELV